MSDAFQLAFACAPAESAKQERKHEAEKHQITAIAFAWRIVSERK